MRRKYSKKKGKYKYGVKGRGMSKVYRRYSGSRGGVRLN